MTGVVTGGGVGTHFVLTRGGESGVSVLRASAGVHSLSGRSSLAVNHASVDLFSFFHCDYCNYCIAAGYRTTRLL